MAMLRRFRFIGLATVLATGIALSAVVPTAAQAQADLADTQCVGMIGPVTVDNIVVPGGATCVLSNTKVKGNVLVKEDGRLQANGAIVDGNVRANKAKSALLQFSSQVKGNLSIKNTTDPAATSGFDINVRVGGNAEFEANKSRVFVDAAMVGGNLTVTKNVNPSVLEVEFNTVGGGVKVEKNAVPTGTSMTVLGNAVGDKMVVSRNS